MNRNTLLCKLCVASVAERQMRRFVAMFPEDELTLNPLETAAHRRFVSEVRRNFDVTALHLQKGLVYLKRIFSATENEPLNPLQTQYSFSLYLLPHLHNAYPAHFG